MPSSRSIQYGSTRAHSRFSGASHLLPRPATGLYRPTDTVTKEFMTIGVARVASTAACATAGSRPTVAAPCRLDARAAMDSSHTRGPAVRPQLPRSLWAAAPVRTPLHRARADHVCQAEQSSGSGSGVGELHDDSASVCLMTAALQHCGSTATSDRAEYQCLQHSHATLQSVCMLRSTVTSHCQEDASVSRFVRAILRACLSNPGWRSPCTDVLYIVA